MTTPTSPTSPTTNPKLVIQLASNNPKKAQELRELCDILRPGRFDILDPFDDISVVENAPDFRGNAWLKCRAWAGNFSQYARDHRMTELPHVDWVIADDSGLIVDALDGRPGVRSARFASDAGFAPTVAYDVLLPTDAANNLLLLQELAGVPDERRTARFFCCVVACNVVTQAAHEATGAVEGRIAHGLSGSGGFGYDPLFIVDEGGVSGRRMAELSAAEKHAISHRGRAMRDLLKLIAP